MKHFTLLMAATCCGLSTVAQPQIESGSNLPSVGTAYTFSVALTSDPGPAGANQVWDFSELAAAFIADAEIIDPSTTPLFTSFSSADYGFSFSADGSTAYSYFNVTSDKMEVLAYVIGAPGGENDYSPNPRTVLKFPFSYQEQVMDSWQEAGNSEDMITLTYDGYGTLMTPSGTFQNVVRIRENYGVGEDDYQWYTLDPLMQVAVYDHNDELLFFAGGLATSVGEKVESLEVGIFPNPAHDHVVVEVDEATWLGNLEFVIRDITGRLVQRGNLVTPNARIELLSNTPGVYFIQLSRADKVLATRRLIVE